ncbi:hypothetical protein, partial [Klebsiella pneumoniae]|uniref:hypothetical protein n=1 Tax=Klebsiella pneumoniae TaxID=573 RepID=UPI0035322980
SATSLFTKLYDIFGFTKEIKEKLNKIDVDMQSSAQNLQLDPSFSSSHHIKVKYLTDMQEELLREEARIRSNLIDIQNMIFPIMDTMQKHISHYKSLVQDHNFSVAYHMIQLSAKVQVALSTCQI